MRRFTGVAQRVLERIQFRRHAKMQVSPMIQALHADRDFPVAVQLSNAGVARHTVGIIRYRLIRIENCRVCSRW